MDGNIPMYAATATALKKQVIALATRPRKDESDHRVVKQIGWRKAASWALTTECAQRWTGLTLRKSLASAAPNKATRTAIA